MPRSATDVLFCGLMFAAICSGRVAAQGTSAGMITTLLHALVILAVLLACFITWFNSSAVLCAAGPSCSALGLPATAASNGASYVKCQSFGGTNWCQNSEAPGWEPCPVLNGQTSPAPDPVQSVSDAKTVCSEHKHLLLQRLGDSHTSTWAPSSPVDCDAQCKRDSGCDSSPFHSLSSLKVR